MKALTTVSVAACMAFMTTGAAYSQTKSPIFGQAAVKVTTQTQNRGVVGKGYYADYYGFYGNYYSNLASQYGLYGLYYKGYSYYNSAQSYAQNAANDYGYASYYQQRNQ
jgi:hypothetical protein